MASAQATLRLQKEYKKLIKEPVDNIQAHPVPRNLLEWRFVLQGPAGSDFAGGHYHGKLVFPPDYPWRPPSISMLTPNGRFAPSVNICMSMSSYHPESWNPLWGVGSMLAGLLSFMLEEAPAAGAILNVPMLRAAGKQ
ncbi:hypothetical protein WJX73_007857 [Symbiochloris irregularis]|uniref:UBC core domain-containing protein n=1 Tax=Symbiochloris irregularis TaxID=706552 RepID=A0AAW1P2K5_9CHLO